MAGIGFELKKLFNGRTASSYLKAYSYSAVITAGPFALMTGMVLAIQLMFVLFGVSEEESRLYTASIIYPFVFSHILSSGFVMVITRYLADLLYSGDHREVTASLFGILAFTSLIGSLAAICFFWNKPLDFFVKLLTYLVFMQMLAIWLQGVYLTAVKNYRGLFQSYICGVLVSILLSFFVLYTGCLPPVPGVLLAMNIGIACIVTLFFVHIIRYFGYHAQGLNFSFLPYFEKHPCLFFIAFFYALALYLPNIIIWQGPMGVRIADTYVYAPVYDVVTFYAFLSILPVMMMFVVSTELHFYEKYAVYFKYITQKGNFKDIEDAKQDVLHTLWVELRNIAEFQLVFSLIFLALGNYFLTLLGLSSEAVNIYIMIVLGAFFLGIVQVMYTMLLYFEDQKGVLWIVGTLLTAVLVFGIIGFFLGEKSYGFTFFLATALAFLAAYFRMAYFCRRIDYFIFCSRPVFYLESKGIFTKLSKWFAGRAVAGEKE